MAVINYLKGDAARPVGEGNRVIVHICNDIGGWGAGFVLALSRRWKEPEIMYREGRRSGKDFELGKVQFVEVEPGLWVANMIGQRGTTFDRDGNPPVRYEAVQQCLARVAEFAREKNATAHMPRIGCGLAGGTWDRIEPLIEQTLIANGIDTFVYDLN